MADAGKISRARMEAYADQARRLGNVSGDLSPAQIQSLLESAVSVSDMPNAEDAYFGTPSTQYEYGVLSHPAPSWGNYTPTSAGNSFIVNKPCSVVGMRVMGVQGRTYYLQVWDAETSSRLIEVQKVFETPGGSGVTGTWTDVLFPTPVNLTAGKKYIFNHRCSSTMGAYKLGAKDSVFNTSKVSHVGGFTADLDLDKDTFPSGFENEYSLYAVDPILGDILAESVTTEYKIQTETMRDIADEVNRIKGTSGTLTTAQIITALQSVPVQTTE